MTEPRHRDREDSLALGGQAESVLERFRQRAEAARDVLGAATDALIARLADPERPMAARLRIAQMTLAFLHFVDPQDDDPEVDRRWFEVFAAFLRDRAELGLSDREIATAITGRRGPGTELPRALPAPDGFGLDERAVNNPGIRKSPYAASNLRLLIENLEQPGGVRLRKGSGPLDLYIQHLGNDGKPVRTGQGSKNPPDNPSKTADPRQDTDTDAEGSQLQVTWPEVDTTDDPQPVSADPYPNTAGTLYGSTPAAWETPDAPRFDPAARPGRRAGYQG